MDPASIAVGVAGIVLSLISSVNKVIGLFEGFRNAPEEIQFLRILLIRVASSLQQGVANDGPVRYIILTENEKQVIEKVLNDCGTFLHKYSRRYDSGGELRRAVGWASGDGIILNQFYNRIERLYLLMIYAKLSPIEQAEDLGPRPVGQAHGGNTAVEMAVPGPEASTRQDSPMPSELGRLAAELQVEPVELPLHHQRTDMGDEGTVPPIPEEHLQELDTMLGEERQQILDTGAVQIDRVLQCISGTNVTFQDDDDPSKCRILKLVSLERATREEKTIILHFRCADGVVSMTHNVPFADPPFISDIQSGDVSFRATHAMSIKSCDGHHFFRVRQPRYSFSDVNTRRKFQALVRDRKFVGEFEAHEIATLAQAPRSCLQILLQLKSRWIKVHYLAAGEPLQLWQQWQRLENGTQFMSAIMTMTFRAEIAGRFVPVEADFVSNCVKIVRAEGSSKMKAVEGQWIIRDVDADQIRITFQSGSEAVRFADLFASASRTLMLPPISTQLLIGSWEARTLQGTEA